MNRDSNTLKQINDMGQRGGLGGKERINGKDKGCRCAETQHIMEQKGKKEKAPKSHVEVFGRNLPSWNL